MSNSEKFYCISAIILLVTIAYFSMNTRVVERVTTVFETQEVPIFVTDTLTVTKVDTLWEYKMYEDDVVLNGANVVMNKRFLFHLAEDTPIPNIIRNALPFGDVFNYWRDILGPCGMFDWNGSLYLTLYKEESIDDCSKENL